MALANAKREICVTELLIAELPLPEDQLQADWAKFQLVRQAADEAQVMRTAVPDNRRVLGSADVRRLQRVDEADIVVAAELADELAVLNVAVASLEASRQAELSAETVREQHQQEEADVDDVRDQLPHMSGPGNSSEEITTAVLATHPSVPRAGQPEAIE